MDACPLIERDITHSSKKAKKVHESWSVNTTLPLGPDQTRMIRLLPHEEKNAQIECELFTYSLAETSGTYLYEALSYVWAGDWEGSSERSHPIRLNKHDFKVTANLHAALVNLRYHEMERVLWVDAICIDQDNADDKVRQIPLMRSIYAEACHVIVWLGEAHENGDKALKTIRGCALFAPSKDSESDNDYGGKLESLPCSMLLMRGWFSRIWVLQEVGVARSISVMCGSVQISGHTFCKGLVQLELSSLPRLIYPVIRLIRGANRRSKHRINRREAFSIGELVDMYRAHEATVQHDKIYALLGLSVDGLGTTALRPNYELPWHEVFRQIIAYIFPGKCSVETWPGIETAVIKTKGWILGIISSVQRYTSQGGRQDIKVLLNETAESLGYPTGSEATWRLQASAELVERGDIICLLEGSLKPSIIRLRGNYFKIIITTVTPQQGPQGESLDTGLCEERQAIKGSTYDILLTWKIPLADAEFNSSEPIDMAPLYQETPLERTKRLEDMTTIVNDIAMQIFRSGGKYGVMECLLRQSSPRTKISEELFKAEAGKSKSKIVKLLLEYKLQSLPVSEELLTAAAGYEYGLKIVKVLLQHQENLLISEDLLKAAAGNNGTYGYRIMGLLLQHQKDLQIPEKVVEAAAGNMNGHGMMKVLLHHQKNLQISEEVVQTAAESLHGHEILEVLLEHRGKGRPISEKVVKTVAGNDGGHGHKKMEVLLQHQKDIQISQEVVKVAAANRRWGHKMMESLFRHQEGLLVSDEAMNIAAGNKKSGAQIMEIILRHRGENPPG